MTDDTFDREALASAYLDDEVTADERARVEGDPSLVAAVEQMRAVRALLADAEPAAISLRESHLAAALAAWDRIPAAERSGALRDATPDGVDPAAAAAAATVSAPARIADRRRPTSTRWLTAAAAVFAVAAASVVAVRFSDADDDSSDAGSVADEAERDAASLASEDASSDALSSEAGDAATNQSDGDQSGGDGGAETEAVLEAAPDAEEFDTEGTIDTGITEGAPPPEEGLVVLSSPAELAEFAAAGAAAPVSPDVPAATSAPIDDGDLTRAEQVIAGIDLPDCPALDRVVGPALYDGVVVVVGIDDGRDLVIAAGVDDCVEVARVRLP